MLVTCHLFEAYLKCPTKCFLRSVGAMAPTNLYAEWSRMEQQSYRVEAAKQLVSTIRQSALAVDQLDVKNLPFAKWLLAADQIARTPTLESIIHVIERLSTKGRNSSANLIPIRFLRTNNPTKDDKLLVAFDGLVLSGMLGTKVGIGKIIYGEDHATLRVKTAALASKVQGLLDAINALLSSDSPPDLVLNKHCPECEFQTHCRARASEKDDLSLLSGMTENERNRHRSKGIFTVTQLSYTFRPRRTPKRAKNPTNPRYLALQALAIRESTVYVNGSPIIPDSTTQVYLDIEGLPGNSFYYLIGALVVSHGKETFFTFWADHQEDELHIFSQFIEIACGLPELRVFHFGDYEAVALKRIKARLPESLRSRVDAILERMTNALSVIHPHIYFPTYSNGLKDIGRFLGIKRADENATGLQSIIWRKTWSTSKDPEIKSRLIQYNQDDCRTLKLVCDFVSGLSSTDSTRAQLGYSIPTNRAKELTGEDLIGTCSERESAFYKILNRSASVLTSIISARKCLHEPIRS